ncbi:hypothetical protein [uncultured Clostridium sp.]|uniref:hypothetical protein n=1 Tax=uncultured Clostridium sp. TaxID=59620 RepID=UPI00262DFCC5|nr:hypothetical protein [uncultured Clostridium sp.]
MKNQEEVLMNLETLYQLESQKDLWSNFDLDDYTCKDYPGVIEDIYGPGETSFINDYINSISPLEEDFSYEDLPEAESIWDKIIPSRRRRLKELREAVEEKNAKTRKVYNKYKEIAEAAWNEIKDKELSEIAPYAHQKVKEYEDFYAAHPEFHIPKNIECDYGYYGNYEDMYFRIKYNPDKYDSISQVIKELAREKANRDREEAQEIAAAKQREEKAKRILAEAARRAEIAEIVAEMMPQQQAEPQTKKIDYTKCPLCRWKDSCSKTYSCNFSPKDSMWGHY